MQIYKYRHACMVLEKAGETLVIDPGTWATDFVMPPHVVGVIVTHEHGDHYDPDKLEAILTENPKAALYVAADMAEKLPDAHIATPNDTVQIGSFTVAFTGGKHSPIHNGQPECDNVGVLVDEGEFYYPGDSFALPGSAVSTLAVPAGGPWMKTGEAVDFILEVKPKEFFSTHDAIFSPEGQTITDNWFSRTAKTIGADYVYYGPMP